MSRENLVLLNEFHDITERSFEELQVHIRSIIANGIKHLRKSRSAERIVGRGERKVNEKKLAMKEGMLDVGCYYFRYIFTVGKRC